MPSTTITTTLKPTLLTLPRELRNEIYTQLFLPSHTYSVFPRPDPYNFRLPTPNLSIYIEDEIFLPTRPPLNLLHTCAQTRHEVLEQTAFAFNSPHARHQPHGAATPPPPSSPPPNPSAAPVTLTFRRRNPVRGWSSSIPDRNALSPRFHALIPVLTLLKRLHFTIWAGWDGRAWWWPPTHIFTPPSPGAHTVARRASCVETNCVKITPRMDASGWMLGKVLGCLSGVEDVEVEMRMLWWEYRNWDSPGEWRERMEGWLRESVVGDGGGERGRRRWKRVERRMVVCETVEEGGKQVVFFRKEEVFGGGGKGAEVLVTEEMAKVSYTFSGWAPDSWGTTEYITRTYTRRE